LTSHDYARSPDDDSAAKHSLGLDAIGFRLGVEADHERPSTKIEPQLHAARSDADVAEIQYLEPFGVAIEPVARARPDLRAPP
jgi:hypothetical protein